jgi:hypothetical protein
VISWSTSDAGFRMPISRSHLRSALPQLPQSHAHVGIMMLVVIPPPPSPIMLLLLLTILITFHGPQVVADMLISDLLVLLFCIFLPLLLQISWPLFSIPDPIFCRVQGVSPSLRMYVWSTVVIGRRRCTSDQWWTFHVIIKR